MSGRGLIMLSILARSLTLTGSMVMEAKFLSAFQEARPGCSLVKKHAPDGLLPTKTLRRETAVRRRR